MMTLVSANLKYGGSNILLEQAFGPSYCGGHDTVTAWVL
jgi:hypothetical protein